MSNNYNSVNIRNLLNNELYHMKYCIGMNNETLSSQPRKIPK